MVGALLVAAAAVATFAIYLDGTAGPDTAYVVAQEPVEPGKRFDRLEDVTASFGTVTVDLAEPLRGRALAADELDALVGRTLLAPLQRGDLLTRTHLLDDAGAAPAQTLSFPIATSDAVAGALRPGERVDVVATYGSGDRAYTAYVVRGVPLLRTSGGDGAAVGGEAVGSQLTLTVAVTDPEDVQRLSHAVNTAQLLVTRSPATPGGRAAPGAYRPRAAEPGPTPDPATGSHTEDGR
ncbi:MAG: RcpC/CpaB family pilus assembly protein [Nitriliruptoraceae bacterium]